MRVSLNALVGSIFVLLIATSIGLAADCNTNGIEDGPEILGATTPDCNVNAIPDDCDILQGTSLDADIDSIPDECQGPAALRLLDSFGSRASGDCLQPGSGSNETLVVSVSMEHPGATIVGGQFFMEYDNTSLDFLTIHPGDAPFTQEVFGNVDEALGRITYIVGIENNGTGTSADTVMARMQFTALVEGCASAALVEFRRDTPIPTRLSNDNDGPVYAAEIDLSPVTIDSTAPFVANLVVSSGGGSGACESTVTFAADVIDNCAILAADVTAQVTLVAPNATLGTPTIIKTQVSPDVVHVSGEVSVTDIQSCPVTVQVSIGGQDFCGNDAVVTSDTADVDETAAPVISGFTVTGGNVDGSCQATANFSATVTDNCSVTADNVTVNVTLPTGNATLGSPTITKTQVNSRTVSVSGSVPVSDLQSCPATVRVTIDAVDGLCGNTASQAVQTANILDAGAPVISGLIATGGGVDASCQATVNFSGTVADNCRLLADDVTVSVTLPTANAALGAPTITKTQVNSQTVSISGSVLVSAVENCPATVRVTVNAVDATCGNAAIQAVQNANVTDATAPVIGGLTMTDAIVDGDCNATLNFSATVTDNCFVDADDVAVSLAMVTSNATLGTPTINKVQTNGQTVTVSGSVVVSDLQSCPATVRLTINATDDCANPATTATRDANVNDVIGPVISDLVVNGGNVDADCAFDVTFSATISDNCDVGNILVILTVTLPTNNADLADPVVSLTPVNDRTLLLSGTSRVSNLLSCPARIRVRLEAVGSCGNSSAPVTQSGFVFDVSPPVLTIPSDVSVHSDAGSCQALLAGLPMATAVDNCDPTPTLTFVRSDGKPNLQDPYEAADSPISVTWQAGDDCGNTATGVTVVEVSDQNESIISVELSPTLDDVNGPFPGGVLNRCVRLELWKCPDDLAPSGTVDFIFPFSTDAGLPNRASNIPVLLPCGDYTCITARDRLHTLRSTSPDFADQGTYYTASFIGNRATGGHWMVGGNLNDDTFIDVLDFGSFVTRFQTFYGTGDTDCSTPAFHPDLSGEGLVFTSDFTFIQINILRFNEPNCCGNPGFDGPAPVTSISVADLWRRGLGELAVADLNGDGMLDFTDMAVYMERNGIEGTLPAVETRVQPVQIKDVRRRQ